MSLELSCTFVVVVVVVVVAWASWVYVELVFAWTCNIVHSCIYRQSFRLAFVCVAAV